MTYLTSACLSLLCAALLLIHNSAGLENAGATDHAAELTTSLLEFIVKTGGRENRIQHTVCPSLSAVRVNRTAQNQGFHRYVCPSLSAVHVNRTAQNQGFHRYVCPSLSAVHVNRTAQNQGFHRYVCPSLSAVHVNRTAQNQGFHRYVCPSLSAVHVNRTAQNQGFHRYVCPSLSAVHVNRTAQHQGFHRYVCPSLSAVHVNRTAQHQGFHRYVCPSLSAVHVNRTAQNQGFHRYVCPSLSAVHVNRTAQHQGFHRYVCPSLSAVQVNRTAQNQGFHRYVCPSLSAVQVNRTAQNQGFHRDVVTEVTLPVAMATPPIPCRLLLVETVPAGMYVDLHQVTFRTDFGGPQVLALRDIDVEQAAHQSPHHKLLLYSPLQQGPKGFTWRVVLPVHLRYHRWAGEGEDTSATVKLEGPDVLMHCEGYRPVTTPCVESRLFPAPCDAESQEVCLWQLLSGKAEPLLFQVPLGQQTHAGLVITGTTVAAALGSWLILAAARRASRVSLRREEAKNKEE
ncbi:PIGX [Branchiostoma lanceolatum]|uniref:Phosphatidylinositol-glycan biosynthesis class X protein n=1 Tax=Branchiostoma lanceolatum TaxID=7740 RepID=A0A8K0ACB9_BRALA|nr:PIGX [Branchiostoma lanceolatum]